MSYILTRTCMLFFFMVHNYEDWPVYIYVKFDEVIIFIWEHFLQNVLYNMQEVFPNIWNISYN